MEDGREDGGSSASDLYNIDNPPAQEGIIPSVISAAPANATGSRALTSTNNSDSDNDSDSSSEMDVAESDEEPEPEPKPTPPPQPEPHAAASATGAKRKLGDEATNGSSQTVHALPKKPRLSQSPTVPSATSHPSPQANGTESNGLTTQPTPALSAQPTNGSGAPAAMKLPTELWQRIFLFMPPTALGRCLSVCKTFNIYLTRTKAAPGSKKSKDTTESIRPVDSNELWSHARKIWVPNMPKVLAGYTELQTIQLVGGYSCQSCGKVPAPLTAPSAFEAGPGNHGVRVIWPFGIRTCGQCLEKNTVKVCLSVLFSVSSSTNTTRTFCCTNPRTRSWRLGCRMRSSPKVSTSSQTLPCVKVARQPTLARFPRGSTRRTLPGSKPNTWRPRSSVMQRPRSGRKA